MTKWLQWTCWLLICIPSVIALVATLGVNTYNLSAATIT